MVQAQTALQTCSVCLRAQAHHRSLLAQSRSWRAFSVSHAQANQETSKNDPSTQDATVKEEDGADKGAMSRRLAEMAEETMDTGSKSDRKMMADAGFSEDLKKQLEERIAQSAFNIENQKAIGQASMPSAAGRGTRDQAAAPAWEGNESLQDSALRMLDDAHKRIRMPARKPTLGQGASLRPKPKQKMSVADRLVNARDRTSIYAQQSQDMSEEEREKFRKELKARFEPGARPMPTTLQGLTSLANERIEDAISRGQFKNIQRGKGVNIERDYTASSPFLNTTEYFMNKIIQRQEIVPPWIEKQQEVLKTVNTFRMRLRNDWRRHAARSISSKGGSLEEQMRRAKAYALAEEKHNPRPATKTQSMSSIDPTGMLTTIKIEERIAAGVAPDQGPEPLEIKVTETLPPQDTQKNQSIPQEKKIIAEGTMLVSTVVVPNSESTTQPDSGATNSPRLPSPDSDAPGSQAIPTPSSPQSRLEHVLPMATPFRDPAWEKTESGYHNLAISEINALTRSYNLMAPKIAQKPYYTLARELNRCYAEVAPTLADEILTRSRKGPVKIQIAMHKEGSVMQKFSGTGHVAKVRDEPEARGYGFKEFWKDLFSKDDEQGKRGKKDTV